MAGSERAPPPPPPQRHANGLPPVFAMRVADLLDGSLPWKAPSQQHAEDATTLATFNGHKRPRETTPATVVAASSDDDEEDEEQDERADEETRPLQLHVHTGIDRRQATMQRPVPSRESSDGADTSTPVTTATSGRKTKKRKSTHLVRKEEKAALMAEMATLEARLAFLRGQVFAPQAVADQATTVQPQVSNDVLRQTIQEQHLRFAYMRSMMSQFLEADLAAPTHPYIHLTKSMPERRALLLGLKPEQLRASRLFLEERCRFVDLNRSHMVNERFVTNNGDSCCLRFNVDQFPGAFSVREVYDALAFFAANLEISLTETAGHVTIREDDDTGDLSLSQHRLVTSFADGAVMIDTNCVLFSSFDPAEDTGIVSVTFVDEDDLHPYRPTERVRQDVVGVMTISKKNEQIIIRRWMYVRVGLGDWPNLSEDVRRAVHDCVGEWGDFMLEFLRHRLCNHFPAPSPPPRSVMPSAQFRHG